jgi:alkaline phosphatase D
VQTRRQFLTAAGTAAAAVVLAPEALAGATRGTPLARGGRFRAGVMSGEPTTRGISLWTRVDGIEGTRLVELEVARDEDFRRIVGRRRITTSERLDHNVKARVEGLRPHEQYFYRFSTASQEGPVGRFRTALPADSRQPVRFAFYSCQEFSHGYYNAHAVMAEDDLDFVVCLGDYIYAETYTSPATNNGVRTDRIGREKPYGNVLYVAETLSDYRRKYRLYRSDPSLRKVQASFPTIQTWDDHEVQNNYAGGPSNGGLPAEERFRRSRQRAAYRAFFEATPYFPRRRNRVYQRLTFGRTVDLIVMDQRQYRDNQPCKDAVAPPCADLDRPRDFLGRTQMRWVKDQLRSSKAAWKVMASELMVMPAKVLGGAFFTYDNWQGYPREREELLTFIADRGIKDVVFVTGDIHTFIAGDVRTQMGAGPSVALEFVGGSITSQALGEIDINAGGVTLQGNDANPQTSPTIIEALRGINPWVDVADFDHHGYGKVTATTDHLDCELVRVETIKRRTTATLPPDGFRYRVQRGQTSIKGVNGPPA